MRLGDLSGQTFGRLKAIAPAESNRHGTKFLCRCECSGETKVYARHLVAGMTRSCGCLRSEQSVENGRRRRIHGHSSGRRGVNRTPEYTTWVQMRQRATNPQTRSWKSYGGRGITVCQEWMGSFEAFYRDIGPRAPGRSIDRIDVNGNYEPGNVRWATHAEQRANRRPLHHTNPRAAAYIRARKIVAKKLAGWGFSQKQIARVVWVAQGTISRDLQRSCATG
jgi:hypothetical protein